jgi:hypothetical protein
MILFVFYSFYYVANPEFVFPLASGVVVGFVSEVLIIAILAGVRVLDTGISDVSIKAVAVIGTIVNILFAIKINTGTGGNIIINLPLAATVLGVPYTIKKASSDLNTITISTQGGQYIDGKTTYVLLAPWQSINLISNGTLFLRSG